MHEEHHSRSVTIRFIDENRKVTSILACESGQAVWSDVAEDGTTTSRAPQPAWL